MIRKYLSVSRGANGFTVSIEEDFEITSIVLSSDQLWRFKEMMDMAKNSSYTDDAQTVFAVGDLCRALEISVKKNLKR